MIPERGCIRVEGFLSEGKPAGRDLKRHAIEVAEARTRMGIVRVWR